MTLKQVIEALVFASPKPIATKEIVAALRAAADGSEDAERQDFAKAKDDEVLAALSEVQADLTATSRAFQLVERVNGWTLVSDPACAAWVRQLYPEAKPTRLTGPQLETLAIIAYRQPSTRADIEAVRGVSVDGVMQVLLDRGLVKIAGRAEVPGRPLLYSTTEYFLEHFGLKNTDELPNATELKRVVLPTAPLPEEKTAAPASPEPQPESSSVDKVYQANADGAPSDADGAPGDADGAPDDADGPPSDADGAPDDADGPPGDADGAPSDADGAPDDADGAPDDADGAPGDADGAPGDADGAPGDADDPPGGGDGNPDDRTGGLPI